MKFNNSAARRVPIWSSPKSYNSRSKSGDWVRTFDPPIHSNGDWPKISVTVFVSIRDTFHLAGLHMRRERLLSRVDRACKFNTTEWHSERWRPLWFHESEITKFVLSYLAKKHSCFNPRACSFASWCINIDVYYEYVRVFIWINWFMNGTNFNIFTLTVPTLQLIYMYNATYWYFYRCQHYHKGPLTHPP